jgi:proteasome lid subunit RPN8/RPN11
MTMWGWRKSRWAKAKGHEGPPKPAVWISTGLLDQTVTVLRQSGDGDGPHEGVAYWAGRRVGHECVITTCIAPAAVTTYGSFDTTAQTNAKVVMYLASAGLELIGQVHSHPGRLVGHSDGDDERALMPYEGFLSVVVPHYGRRGMRPLTTCGIHLFENSRFRRLTDAEIETRFHVVDNFADLRT